jgi:hypothetical protein
MFSSRINNTQPAHFSQTQSLGKNRPARLRPNASAPPTPAEQSEATAASTSRAEKILGACRKIGTGTSQHARLPENRPANSEPVPVSNHPLALCPSSKPCLPRLRARQPRRRDPGYGVCPLPRFCHRHGKRRPFPVLYRLGKRPSRPHERPIGPAEKPIAGAMLSKRNAQKSILTICNPDGGAPQIPVGRVALRAASGWW